jgi:protein-tyrosine phosphatase
MNILFVCDGNIARSPMAEGMLKASLAKRGIASIHVSSCGLQVKRTEAHPMLKLVMGNDYEMLKGFRPRSISLELLRQTDLVLTMEERHVREISKLFPEMAEKVSVVTTFAGQSEEIKDFAGGEPTVFLNWLQQCHTSLERCLSTIVDKIQES